MGAFSSRIRFLLLCLLLPACSYSRNSSDPSQGAVGGPTGPVVTRPLVPVVPVALKFLQTVGNTYAGAPLPTLQVAAVDANGNVVTSDSEAINVSEFGSQGLPGSPAPNGGVTETEHLQAGVTTFAKLIVNHTGYYIVIASSARGLSVMASNPATVSPGPPDSVRFDVQASDTTVAGATLAPSVVVGVYDKFGNLEVFDPATVSVSLANAAGATLGGTTAIKLASGRATFSDLHIDRPGTYHLVAAVTGIPATNSRTFTVVP